METMDTVYCFVNWLNFTKFQLLQDVNEWDIQQCHPSIQWISFRYCTVLSISRVFESQVHSKSRFLIGQCIIIRNDVMIDQSVRTVLILSKTFFWTMNKDGGKSKNLNNLFWNIYYWKRNYFENDLFLTLTTIIFWYKSRKNISMTKIRNVILLL